MVLLNKKLEIQKKGKRKGREKGEREKREREERKPACLKRKRERVEGLARQSRGGLAAKGGCNSRRKWLCCKGLT